MNDADKAYWIFAITILYFFVSAWWFVADIGRWDLRPERASVVIGCIAIAVILAVFAL